MSKINLSQIVRDALDKNPTISHADLVSQLTPSLRDRMTASSFYNARLGWKKSRELAAAKERAVATELAKSTTVNGTAIVAAGKEEIVQQLLKPDWTTLAADLKRARQFVQDMGGPARASEVLGTLLEVQLVS